MIGSDVVETTVRVGTPADKAAINSLLDSLFPDDPNRLTDAEFGLLGRDVPLAVLLAEVQGRICGFTVLRNRVWRPWTSIDFVGVAAQSKNQGIGRKLMEAACAHTCRPLLRLFVHASNMPAISLYQHMGFSHISTKKTHYPNGEDALVMMRWIGLGLCRA